VCTLVLLELSGAGHVKGRAGLGSGTDGSALEECILDGGLHAQAFRSEGNIGSPTDRASNGIDPREHPECIDVCAKDPSSGQFCGVKALFPILEAAFVAGELAGRPCSTINLSTLKFGTRDRFRINRRALPAMRRAVALMGLAGRAVRR
jgi:hypothetical protein